MQFQAACALSAACLSQSLAFLSLSYKRASEQLRRRGPSRVGLFQTPCAHSLCQRRYAPRGLSRVLVFGCSRPVSLRVAHNSPPVVPINKVLTAFKYLILFTWLLAIV